MKVLISEVFDQLKAAYATAPEGEEDKAGAEVLTKYRSGPLMTMLRYNFDPSIKFMLPQGVPDYKEQQQKAGTSLYLEFRQVYIFLAPHATERYHPVTSQDTDFGKKKREMVYFRMLETLNPEEAKIFVALVNKSLPVRRETVELAFPGLLPGQEPASDQAPTTTEPPKTPVSTTTQPGQKTTPPKKKKPPKKNKPATPPPAPTPTAEEVSPVDDSGGDEEFLSALSPLTPKE